MDGYHFHHVLVQISVFEKTNKKTNKQATNTKTKKTDLALLQEIW